MKRTPGIFRSRFEAAATLLVWAVIAAGLVLVGWAVAL